MAFVSSDRIYDTSTTTSTSPMVVSGSSATGYKTFSAVMSVGDTCYYSIAHQSANEWEVGLGTYSSANTITRTTVYTSSNSNAAVSFSAGTKDVMMVLAASRTVQRDNSGNVNISDLVITTDLTFPDSTIQITAALIRGQIEQLRLGAFT
jgi:hypothetical protein